MVRSVASLSALCKSLTIQYSDREPLLAISAERASMFLRLISEPTWLSLHFEVGRNDARREYTLKRIGPGDVTARRQRSHAYGVCR